MWLKIKKALAILVILCIWGAAADAKVRFAIIEVYFSPGNECRAAIKKKIMSAEKNIRVMTYCLTDSELIDELVGAKKRGVSIEVLAGDMNLEKYAKIEKLLKAEIPIRAHDSPGVMHHNVAIIDDKIVITGSYNWSVEASENCEDLLIIEDREMAAQYNDVFNRVFSGAKGAEDVKKALLLEKEKKLAEVKKEKEAQKQAAEKTEKKLPEKEEKKDDSERRKPATSVGGMDFGYAHEGDYWIIEDDDIAVCIEPNLPANKAQFLRNLVTAIGRGTKVEILERKGIFSPWMRVYVYNRSDKIYAEGWILAETVKKAKRIQKGAFSP